MNIGEYKIQIECNHCYYCSSNLTLSEIYADYTGEDYIYCPICVENNYWNYDVSFVVVKPKLIYIMGNNWKHVDTVVNNQYFDMPWEAVNYALDLWLNDLSERANKEQLLVELSFI